jgi:hypothetical protein
MSKSAIRLATADHKAGNAAVTLEFGQTPNEDCNGY